MYKCTNCNSYLDTTQTFYCSKDCELEAGDLPVSCGTCNASGYAGEDYCIDCHGTGCISEMRDYS